MVRARLSSRRAPGDLRPGGRRLPPRRSPPIGFRRRALQPRRDPPPARSTRRRARLLRRSAALRRAARRGEPESRRILEEENRCEAALSHYKAALRADPLRTDAHLATALLYEKLGLRRRAREHWRRYLQCAPAGAWAEIAKKRVEEAE
jgi:tetratricopeptide (TPR) repeat protein